MEAINTRKPTALITRPTSRKVNHLLPIHERPRIIAEAEKGCSACERTHYAAITVTQIDLFHALRGRFQRHTLH
jgi:hypothetical protein